MNPHSLGFTKLRFWSSSDKLPIERIIANILADPTENDVSILLHTFDKEIILNVWNKLLVRNEVHSSVIPITTKILQEHIMNRPQDTGPGK